MSPWRLMFIISHWFIIYIIVMPSGPSWIVLATMCSYSKRRFISQEFLLVGWKFCKAIRRRCARWEWHMTKARLVTGLEWKKGEYKGELLAAWCGENTMAFHFLNCVARQFHSMSLTQIQINMYVCKHTNAKKTLNTKKTPKKPTPKPQYL